ncbi:hypothetical protein HZA43_05280 [Candidatus Peregrinibacteria bacterium]|nr:hypothetical protein [Candidatus Peregrinibacteria bacterium]
MFSQTSPQDLISQIQSSVVFDADQKKLLTQLLPRLNEAQKQSIVDFLVKEKTTLGAVEKEYAEKRTPLYKAYAEKMKQAFQKAKKMILQESEKKSKIKEESTEEILKQI